MQTVQVQGLADLGQLLDEPVHRPQREIIGAIGATAAELVVEDDAAVFGEGFEGLEVVVGEAGAAVQAEQRDRVLVVADRAVPDLAAGDVDSPFFCFHAAPSLETGSGGASSATGTFFISGRRSVPGVGQDGQADHEPVPMIKPVSLAGKLAG